LIKYEFNNKYFSLIKLKSKLMSLQTRYPPHNLIFKKFITHFINQFQLAISTVKNKEFHVDAPFCITVISQFPCTSLESSYHNDISSYSVIFIFLAGPMFQSTAGMSIIIIILALHWPNQTWVIIQVDS
jgi:hypothetical protein